MDRSLRNVLVVSLGFLLLFTAYGGLQSLQVRVCDRLAPSASGNPAVADAEERGPLIMPLAPPQFS